MAIIGILAAIAIPNLLTAMQRSKQKRTMADLRTIANAWESRATDVNRYNAAGVAFVEPSVDMSGSIATYLSPTYVKSFPVNDGWNNPWIFKASQAWGSSIAAQEYEITSKGKDGTAQSSYIIGPTTNFDCDIVYNNGSFIQYPEGVQQQ